MKYMLLLIEVPYINTSCWVHCSYKEYQRHQESKGQVQVHIQQGSFVKNPPIEKQKDSSNGHKAECYCYGSRNNALLKKVCNYYS